MHGDRNHTVWAAVAGACALGQFTGAGMLLGGGRTPALVLMITGVLTLGFCACFAIEASSRRD